MVQVRHPQAFAPQVADIFSRLQSRQPVSRDKHLALLYSFSKIRRGVAQIVVTIPTWISGRRESEASAPFVGSGLNQIPDSPWIPLTVVVRVRSPSGAVYGFETVRLQRRPVQ